MMTKHITGQSDQADIALFREEIGEVEHIAQDKIIPVTKSTKIKLRVRQNKPTDLQSELSDLSEPTTVVGSEETLSFRRSGIQERLLSRLRSGGLKLDAELDLHGMTIPIAHQALLDFIRDCIIYNIRGARIIHGKGWSSKHHKPILKSKLNIWLREMDDILAFCSARIEDGGTGALYILLRRNNKNK